VAITESQKELTSTKGKAALVEIWSKEIENASKKEANFRKEANSYLDVYRNVANNTNDLTHPEGYNVYWSNTQTLRPLVFSNLPDPNVTRRFLDTDDEKARIASVMIERSLSYFQEQDDTTETYNKTRDDYLVPGRGVARVIFDPAEVVEIEEEIVDQDTGDAVVDVREELDIDTKKVRVEYVEWDDIRISPEKTWKEVRWVAFKHKMTRDQLIEQFGEKGKKVDLNYSILEDTDNSELSEEDEIFKQAEVWEVWDKTSGRIIFLTIGGNGSILSDEEDNYNLKGFFPVPRLLGSDSDPTGLTPIPLFRMYKAQADELNALDARIRNLVEQVKFTGVYNSMAETTNIESIMNGCDGEIAPLKGIQPGTKLSDMIEYKPIIDLVNTIVALRTQKADILQNIRDITGLSDIVRGTTLASETATAQRLKGDFAISRIQPLQKEFEVFIRNTERLRAELILEQFSIEELAKITNLEIVDINLIQRQALQRQAALFDEAVQQLDPNDPQYQEKIDQLNQQQEAGFQATMQPFLDKLKGYAATPEQLQQIDALIKSDKARSFSVDIETDSTVRIDQNQEKADRLEYAQAISTFFSQATPILQVGGINKTAFNEMLAFISAPFKVGRNLEEYLLSEEEEPEQQGPSIEEQLAQAESQRKDQELQLKAQEVDIKQQLANVEKAKVKVDIEQFNDKLEFEDVNKEADRRAKTLDQVIQDRTERATTAIRESDLV
jgi:hypothetical protein